MSKHLKFVIQPKYFFDYIKKIFDENKLYIISPTFKSPIHWNKFTDLDDFWEEYKKGQIKYFYLCEDIELLTLNFNEINLISNTVLKDYSIIVQGGRIIDNQLEMFYIRETSKNCQVENLMKLIVKMIKKELKNKGLYINGHYYKSIYYDDSPFQSFDVKRSFDLPKLRLHIDKIH
jgi:hypothetical protein